jgi:hypothetical protein
LTTGTWNATTIAVANGGTGVTSSTGTGSVVLSASPTFTGTPLAPNAAPGTNTAQIATTAFVQNVASGLGTMSSQNANNVNISGGAINGTTVGATTAGTVRGTTVTATSQFSGPGTGLTGSASGLSIGGSAATVGLSQFASLLSANGYQFLPSGLLIQWRTVNGFGSGDFQSFPIAFPNNVFAIFVQARASSTPSTNNIIVTENSGLSGFALWANASQVCNVFAIGN